MTENRKRDFTVSQLYHVPAARCIRAARRIRAAGPYMSEARYQQNGNGNGAWIASCLCLFSESGCGMAGGQSVRNNRNVDAW